MRKISVAVTSDTHGSPFAMPDAEVFIHCGDMTGCDKLQEWTKFAKKLNESRYKRGFLVPGNHDGFIQRNRRLAQDMFDPRFSILINETAEYKGLKLYGSPWTLPFMRWSFMAEENVIRERLSNMPDDLDILITHGPPLHHLDAVGEENTGSYEVLQAVVEKRPYYHVFGHIHTQAGRMTGIKDTTMYNVAFLNDDYQPVSGVVKVLNVMVDG